MKKALMFLFMVMAFAALYPQAKPLKATDEPSKFSITTESLLKYPENSRVHVFSFAEGAFLYSVTGILGSSKVIYSVNKSVVLEVNMNPTAFFESGDSLYLGGFKNGKNVLIRIRKANRQITEKVFDDTIRIKAGFCAPDGIILAGSKADDGYVARLDSNMNIVGEQTYGGEGIESYDTLERVGDIYLLSGVKDAYSEGMANVGNLGEKKAFLTLLNDDLSLIRHEYLNFHTPDESISRMFSDDLGVFLLVAAYDDYYVCRLDQDFSFVYSTSVKGLTGLIPDVVSMEKGYDSNIIIVAGEKTRIGIGIIKEETGEKQLFSILSLSGQLDKTELSGGLLNLFVVSSNELFLNRIEHFEETDRPFTCAKDHCPMERMDDIGTWSYLGEITASRKSISPYFSNNLSGTYEAVYEVKLPSGRTFNKVKTINVLPYVNVIDGGIYPVNYVLDFFDNGRLNGVSVTRNKKLTTPGDYVLVLKNNIGQSRTINFKVVEDYYKDGTDNIQPYDYAVLRNQELKIRLPFDTSYNIEGLVINDIKINDFTYRNGIFEFNILPPEEEGLYYYTISEILQTFKGIQLSSRINQVLSVLVLKEEPQIEVEKLAGKLEFVVTLSDPSATITDIGVNVYEDEVFKTTFSALLHDMELKLDNLGINRSYRFEYFISYHLGDGILKKKTILDCQSEVYAPRLDLGKIAITRQNQVLEEIRISFSNTGDEIDHVKMTAGGSPVPLPAGKNQYYQGLLMGSGMIVLSVIIAVIIRRIKRKPETN